MKKLFAFLLACMMLLSVTTAFAADDIVSAYTAVQLDDALPAGTIRSVSHTLALVDGATELPYEFSYTFSIGSLEVVAPTDIEETKYSALVEGSPVLADGNKTITYTSADFDGVTQKTKTLAVDWSNVKVKEPGVYRWKVTKTLSPNASDGDKPSENNPTSYLFVSVVDENGKLVVSSANLATNEALTEKNGFNDTYPAQQLDLSVSKKVTGNQGSKSQYFEFTVQLKLPAGYSTDKIAISGINATVPATAYHGTQTNTLTFAPISDSNYNYQATFWLKDGDTAKISGLPYGSSYDITENKATCEGYSGVSTEIDGDTDAIKSDNKYSVTDGKLTGTTTVAYTNTKDSTVPTGIDLQTGAPIMGLLMAAAMMLMLFAGKRKEAAE